MTSSSAINFGHPCTTIPRLGPVLHTSNVRRGLYKGVPMFRKLAYPPNPKSHSHDCFFGDIAWKTRSLVAGEEDGSFSVAFRGVLVHDTTTSSLSHAASHTSLSHLLHINEPFRPHGPSFYPGSHLNASSVVAAQPPNMIYQGHADVANIFGANIQPGAQLVFAVAECKFTKTQLSTASYTPDEILNFEDNGAFRLVPTTADSETARHSIYTIPVGVVLEKPATPPCIVNYPKTPQEMCRLVVSTPEAIPSFGTIRVVI